MVLSSQDTTFAGEYSSITHNQKYMQLKNIPRHGSTNTYDHSVRVAHAMSYLAPIFHVDKESAIKVGLLHDFCMVDYHKDDKATHHGEWYGFYHPVEAVENAESEGFYLNITEKRAIWSHMFPLSKSIPTSRLGYMLTLADKKVAFEESFANAYEAYQHGYILLRGMTLRLLPIRK